MIYAKPEVDVILYENVDIVTLSGGDSPVVPVDPTDPIIPPIPTGCQTAINVFKECTTTASWKVVN